MFIVFLQSVSSSLTAQNIESIGKEKAIRVNGGMSLNQIIYWQNAGNLVRDPYSYFASGNLSLSLYGWTVPLSFSFSDGNSSFHQPFNQYSIHPTYKSFTGHFGYTSVSYSSYTVSGHIFFGAALDVAPKGKWQLSGLYGRFLKAVEADTTNVNGIPSYKRMGHGFKASFNHNRNSVDIILFRSKDALESLLFANDLQPEENLAASVAIGKTLFDKFLLRAEYATSALTTDLRTPELSGNYVLSRGGIFRTRLATSFFDALKSSLDFQHQQFTLGIGYERIDPGYRTHGAYYFNNDLKNVTFNGATSILQGKVNLSISAGTQHDNLDKSKISTMTRGILSVNINAMLSSKLNVSGSYSNFQTFTNIRSQFQQINQLSPYENMDTLNFTQLSQNASLNSTLSVGKSKTKKQSLSFSLSLQEAAEKQGDVNINGGMRFYNVNGSYQMNVVPQNLTASISFNGSRSSGSTSSFTYGPVLSVTKMFFDKKLRTSFSTACNVTEMSEVKVSSIVNARIMTALALKKGHNLQASVVAVNRRRSHPAVERTSVVECTATVGYTYSFAAK